MKKLLLSLVIVMVTGFVHSQDYKYHSVFIYNFTKYIQWPSSYQSGDFVIGVFGNSDVIPHLEKMASVKTVGTQKMVVKKFTDVNEINKCHILFIPDQKSGQFDDISSSLNGKPTLVITEKDGLGKKGSSINFIIVGGRYKFELNEEVIANSKLKVSGELAKLAILI